jgi:hypothetical protein
MVYTIKCTVRRMKTVDLGVLGYCQFPAPGSPFITTHSFMDASNHEERVVQRVVHSTIGILTTWATADKLTTNQDLFLVKTEKLRDLPHQNVVWVHGAYYCKATSPIWQPTGEEHVLRL